MNKKTYAVLLVATLFPFFISPSMAITPGDDEDSRSSLRDLAGVSVIIRVYEQEGYLKSLGLDESSLRDDVESKLRLTGMKVVSKEESHTLRGTPYLYVNILVHPVPGGYFLHTSCVELGQEVLLVSDPSIVMFATTWSGCSLGFGTDKTIVKQCRQTIKGLVDLFVKAYLSVNPARRPTGDD